MIINIDKNYYTSKEEAKKHMGMMSNVVSNNIVDLDLSEIVKRVVNCIPCQGHFELV